MVRQPAEIMSISQLSKYLDISVSTLYKLAQDGKLPGQKIGRRWRFHKDAIAEWVKHGNEPAGADSHARTRATPIGR
jgi:excisionase family DNA binding protein